LRTFWAHAMRPYHWHNNNIIIVGANCIRPNNCAYLLRTFWAHAMRPYHWHNNNIIIVGANCIRPL
ncbi:hypothetical protein, partial [Microcystis sp. M054S2]|uniref:hypothetical protein n=1 Tax=Microcystis sp. M054S2 TaxID=2771170 RepID=UPI00258E82F0